MVDKFSKVGTADVASLASGVSSLFSGGWREQLNAAAAKARQEAEAKGIDVDAELARLHAEDL